MFSNIFRTNITENLSKCIIIKNLIVISSSFLFISCGDEGLLMLQTTMNKDGVGTATMATYSIAYGLASLLLSSFIVKKMGSKNSQILGILLILPFIASNAYPIWIAMMLSAVLRGIGKCLHSAGQCTYFNESSVLYCKIKNNRKSTSVSNISSNCKDPDVYNETVTFKSRELKAEQISATDLLHKTRKNHILSVNRNNTIYSTNVLPIRLAAYKDGLSENKLRFEKNNEETPIETNAHQMKKFKDYKKPDTVFIERKEVIFLGTAPYIMAESENSNKDQTSVDSTKAFFFGIHGLATNSSTIWSGLISYYILNTGDNENYNITSNSTCGANFCFTNKDYLNKSDIEVPDNTRHLLIGVYMASGIVAPLVLLFLDGMAKRTKTVKLSWEHVFATIKYIKKKDQLLLIPFTISSCLCRGFYMADFTKAYIACAWSISHIGLITVINGVTAALSSISSGVLIKYVGRIAVLVLCQIMTIANFVFLFFWNPDPKQAYILYVQGGIFGIMSGVYNSQVDAFYGVLFEGDEATAFSSCILYTSIGWALPFIYADFFCVSVKIYIVLAFTCTGLIGYLLAERSYSLRNKQMDPSS